MPQGGSMEAHESVNPIDVFDLLTSLSDRSLVVADQTATTMRHRLLETVRQYGRDLLHDTGESEAVRNLHLDYFLSVAEASEPKLKGAEQMETLARLEEEDENFRAALEWGLHGEGTEESLRLAANLVLFWWRQGHFAEGMEWCLRASKTKAGLQRTVLRARVLNGAGILSSFQGDCTSAQTCYQESLEILTELGDRDYLSETLCGLGFALFFLDDYGASKEFTSKAYELAKELKDDWYTAWSGYFLGIIYRVDGDYDGAMKAFEEALALYRKMGDRIFASYPIYDIGLAEYYRGNMVRARRYLEESLAIRRETKDPWGTAESLFGIGLVGISENNLPSAKESLLEGCEIGRSVGDKTRIAICRHWLAMIALWQGQASEAKRLNDESFAIYRELEDRWGMAHNLAGYAAIAAHEGDSSNAVKLWSASDKIRESIGSPLPPIERARRDQELAAVKSAFESEEAFLQAQQEGAEWSLEQAIESCLAPSLLPSS